MATATVEHLLSAEEFANRPDPGYPEELVRGRIVPMPPPGSRHGVICNRFGRYLGNFAEESDLGWVLSNDSGIITGRGPDTVHGADISYYSYARIPRGEMPEGYPNVPPELVVEVRSPSEGWADILQKIADYFRAGVSCVVVLDDRRRKAFVFSAEDEMRTLGPDEDLTIPGILGDFRVNLSRIFG